MTMDPHKLYLCKSEPYCTHPLTHTHTHTHTHPAYMMIPFTILNFHVELCVPS